MLNFEVGAYLSKVKKGENCNRRDILSIFVMGDDDLIFLFFCRGFRFSGSPGHVYGFHLRCIIDLS